MKITKKELVQLIKEEVDRAKKIKALKEEKTRIDSLLNEMEGMDEYAETQPSDMPGQEVPKAEVDDAMAILKKFETSTKGTLMKEGIMNEGEEIITTEKKKELAKDVSPIIKNEKIDPKDKVKQIIMKVAGNLGIAGSVGAAMTYITSNAALYGAIVKALSVGAAGGPLAFLAILAIIGAVGAALLFVNK